MGDGGGCGVAGKLSSKALSELLGTMEDRCSGLGLAAVGASEPLRSELKDLRSDANDLRPPSESSPAFPSGTGAIDGVLLDGVGVNDLGVDPGIFDRIEPFNDRVDSRVSDLENEG